MLAVEAFLVRYPELAVFLVIAVGYVLGGLRFGGFSFGPVTGSLFAGILVGQIAEVPVSPMAKSFLFLLFLFGIGYSVGPQFLQAIRGGGIKSVVLAVVCPVVGLVVSVAIARLLGLDAGYAVGLLSGGLTQSPAMGTGIEAINALPLPEAERARLAAHVAVADAVCYLFGAAGAIWFCSAAAPRLLGIDLAAEARKLEDEMGMQRAAPGVVSAHRQFELRAFRVPPDAPAVGRTVAEAEAMHRRRRLFVLRLRRGDEILEARPDEVIRAGDVIAVSGRRRNVVEALGGRGEEVEDEALLDMPFLVADVLLSNRETAGLTLEQVAERDWSRGVYLRAVHRGAVETPLAPALELQRGDVLSVVAPEAVMSRAQPMLGPVIAPTSSTDFAVLGLAIFFGGLVGVLMQFDVAGIAVSMGTSVGVLVAGLLIGHMRVRHPLFGRIPDGAVALMTALGLAAFVGMTGLHAGPVFVDSLVEAGVGLFLGGVAVTLAPLLVGLLVGWKLLKMNPVLLLGGLAGAMSMTAAMAAVQDRSGSPVAVLGYTPAYPIAQILLTLWGSVIVALTAS